MNLLVDFLNQQLLYVLVEENGGSTAYTTLMYYEMFLCTYVIVRILYYLTAVDWLPGIVEEMGLSAPNWDYLLSL